MNKIINLSRRDFLKAGAIAGSSLILGFKIPLSWEADAAEKSTSFVPNAYLKIDEAGIITVLVPQSDMGQGVLTSFPMMVAEELDANWKNVHFEQAPAAKVYTNTIIGMQLTGGSSSVRAFWNSVREAGAAARAMLVEAAAKEWKVDAGSCKTENGAVLHPASKRKANYGELVSKAAALSVPKSIKPKTPENYKILGTPENRLDTPAKVRGQGTFGIDVRQTGMLTAVVARCPVFGGHVADFDATDAKKVAGVRDVLKISDGIAVVADTFFAAQKGREALRVQWEEGSTAGQSTDRIMKSFQEASKQSGVSARNDGDAPRVLKKSGRTIEAVYQLPYLAHANMEPMNCTAYVRSGACEIWAPTQGQTLAQRVASKITGVPEESVVVNTTFLGTGFGRRAEQDFVAESVEISKALHVPVKVIWTREDDMQHDHYRPAVYSYITAALDSKGWPIAWMHRVVAPSIFAAHAAALGMATPTVDRAAVEGSADLPYEIPNLRVEYIRKEPGIPVGFWRSVGHSHNTFVVESFLDEVATAGKKDPYELRRGLLKKSPRLRAVLDTAAKGAGWTKPLPKGHYRGIALAEAYGSFVAQVVEIAMEDKKIFRVQRVVCAVDCGQTINPRTIEAQIEGGIVFGLTAALKDAITIDRGRVTQSNFNDYPMLRINEMPVVEVHIAKNHETPGGIGEVGVPTVAPALAGAIFAATGKRIRELPLPA